MSDFGYGQQSPSDASDEFNITAFLVRQMMLRMRTMIPVQVKAVSGGGTSAGGGTVDVQPLVNQVDGNNNPQPHGTIHGVPVWRAQGGDSALVIDPKVDDFGYLAVADRDISTLKEAKKVSNPGSGRAYDLADGVYVGGLLRGAPTQYLQFDDDGFKLLDKNGNTIQGSTSGVDVTPKSGQPVTVHGDVHATGNETFDGNLTVVGTSHLEGTVQTDGDLTVGGNFKVVGSLQVDAGTTIKRILTGSKTTAFGGGNIPALGILTDTVTVTGAKVGDAVVLGMTGPPHPTIVLYAYVSSLNTVTLSAANPLSIAPLPLSSQTYTPIVFGTT